MHHVGTFAALEDQMATWIPGATSPDRMDALVWAATELMVGQLPQTQGYPVGVPEPSIWSTFSVGKGARNPALSDWSGLGGG
jgi:hypothetical protein